MEKASNKYIYETSVKKLVEEKVTEKRVENGVEVDVSRTVKIAKPFKIAILKPDRKKNKEAEIFYAKRLSVYLKEGLLPHSLVSKRYLNDGGPLSENEKMLVESLRDKHVTLQQEYFDMKSPLTEEQIKRRGLIMMELNEINKTLRDIQSNYSEIFSNTAEAKSKSDTIEWWILALGYADIDGKGLQPFFGDGDFESKMKKLDEIEATGDEFLIEIIRKLSYFISFWDTASYLLSLEDFKAAEENYETAVSEYFVEEDKKEETKSESKEGFVPNFPEPTGTGLLINPPIDPTK